jgi:hypothetical protein
MGDRHPEGTTSREKGFQEQRRAAVREPAERLPTLDGGRCISTAETWKQTQTHGDVPCLEIKSPKDSRE